MPTKAKKPSAELLILSSSAPRPRAGVRNIRGAGQLTRGNVLALASSRSARPRAGPIRTLGSGVYTHIPIPRCGCKTRGKGVRPSLDSLIHNTFGKA